MRDAAATGGTGLADRPPATGAARSAGPGSAAPRSAAPRSARPRSARPRSAGTGPCGAVGRAASALAPWRAPVRLAEDSLPALAPPLTAPEAAGSSLAPGPRQEPAPAGKPAAGTGGRAGRRPPISGPGAPPPAAAGSSGSPGARPPLAAGCFSAHRHGSSGTDLAAAADFATGGLADPASSAGVGRPAAGASARSAVTGSSCAACPACCPAGRPAAASPNISSRQITTPMTRSTAASALTPMAR